MVECGSFESEGPSATWKINSLDKKVKLDFKQFYDSTIRTYDALRNRFGKGSSKGASKSSLQDSARIESKEIRTTTSAQVVPVTYKDFSDGDFLSKTECMEHAQVYVNNNQQELIPALKSHREFKKYSVNRDGELTCCFGKNGVCRTSSPTPAKVTADESVIDHTLLACIIAGSLICVIIIVTLAATYLYRRFGHVISERHRRHHHGHRRHRQESQQNSDRDSPPSSQKREPLPVPMEDSAPPPPPSIPLPPPNESVISRMPQHNIVVSGSKEGTNPNYTQVNRNINPLVMENSHSPNRAMTPLKTQEMSTQTCTMTRYEAASQCTMTTHPRTRLSHLGELSSRMSAGSSSSDLSDATLRQPSLQSSRHSTRQSVCPPSVVSSSGFVMPSHQSMVYRTRHSPPQTITRHTNDDYLTTTGATMADDVIDSEEDDDEDSVTRSVEDCERVLAAYKAPGHSTPAAPISAHRTESHLSTRPQFSSASHYTENETSRDGALPNRVSRPHLISLPDRSPRGEEKRRIVENRPLRPIDSSPSLPSDVVPPRTRSTISEVETAARRESTVSWLADSTQLSMGRSMHDDDISL
ncbi:hypothetical protein PRIPAC_94134 [Pristionchus pacificus]|uniref:Uncharacterized protein n=1 Tax=Pristionchus pacificus TaxID=54126 RepID=A0A2A6BQH4_PRIPA|nr:hypothetical protein PRIPAC_94134 [Pristionchus pacificus]|eukprot:PDM68202.1 hypothetical protein PRIPAC_46246 [Pristionchus pacificus]